MAPIVVKITAAILFIFNSVKLQNNLIELKPSKKANLNEQELYFKKKGNWVKALENWIFARKELEQLGKSDPGIGINFIKVCTENKAELYYDLACDMYMWGFYSCDCKNKKIIEEEIARISPILSQKMFKEWMVLLNKGDPRICKEIIKFWQEKDPTPSTKRNERLLEHWFRIAYARKHFNKGKNSVYGTDDRGLIYVKYGKPNRVHTGQLGTRRSIYRYFIAGRHRPFRRSNLPFPAPGISIGGIGGI